MGGHGLGARGAPVAKHVKLGPVPESLGPPSVQSAQEPPPAPVLVLPVVPAVPVVPAAPVAPLEAAAADDDCPPHPWRSQRGARRDAPRSTSCRERGTISPCRLPSSQRQSRESDRS